MTSRPDLSGLRPLTDATGAPIPAQYVLVAPAAPPPKGKGILGRLLGGALLSLFVLSLLANFYLVGIVSLLTMGTHESPYVSGDTKDRIVIVPIEGVITQQTQDFVRQAFQSLEMGKDDMPRAIILRVDSPGGYVGPSDRILHEIETFKKNHPSIPIVASFGSVAASGGYYVSAACDHIMAEPTCTTGSIGVILHAFTFGKLMENIGVEPKVIVADGSPKKDVANNPFRPLDAADEAKLKALLNNAHEQFVAVVTRGRAKALSADEVKKLANGDTFNTKEAVQNKLIDGEGYLDDVIEETKKIAKLSGKPSITWMKAPRQFSLIGSLTGESQNPLPKSGEELRNWLRDASHPRLEFLWVPGM